MRDEAKVSDQDTAGELNDRTAPESLSCPSCAATGFSNLSKLNKHRNGHEKPLECFAEGCHQRFAQRQALDRHTQSRHGDKSDSMKYFHCTVDGCKYASTGRRPKRFARVDQVKEHIKDYGHYGPHSSKDRPRRRTDWKRLSEELVLIARFEEWSLAGICPQRTVRLCEYNSANTKLWHKDDWGDIFVQGTSLGAPNGHSCLISSCYYHQLPPQGCFLTLFNSLKGLQEHRRRAHDSPSTTVPSAFRSQLYQDEDRGSVCSLETLVSSIAKSNTPLDSVTQSDQDWLRDLDFPTAQSFESVQCLNPRCSQNFKHRNPRLEPDRTELSLGDRAIGWCFSCFQNEPALQETNSETSSPRSGMPPQLEFNHLLPISNVYNATSSSMYDASENTTQLEVNTTDANISSLSEKDSLRSSRLSCVIPQCRKTFRRNYEMQRHLMTIHSPATMACTFCWRQFRRKDKLTEHIRHAHSASTSETTKGKAVLDNSSICSGSDWMSSSTYPSNKDEPPIEREASLGTEDLMNDVMASANPPSYSLFSEQWNTWSEECQSSTTQSLEMQLESCESPDLDASKSPTFFTDYGIDSFPHG